MRWISCKNHNLKVIFMVFTTCPPQTTSFIDVIHHLPRRFNNDWNVPTMILGKFWRKSTKKWFYYSNYWYKVNHRICYILHSGSLSDSRLSLVEFTKGTIWPIRVLKSVFRKRGCSKSCVRCRSFYFCKNGEFNKFYKFNFSLWSFICLDQLKRHSDIRLYIIFMIMNIIISIESL